MANNPNTNDFKQTWMNEYLLSHYKVPAYKAIADESLKPDIEKGTILHRTSSSDFVVEDMGGDGGYNNQAWSDVDETLTISFVKDVSFYIKKLDKFQANLPLQMEYCRKAMNNLFLQIDGDVFGAAFAGAGSVVDDGSLGGTPGDGILLTVGNVMAVAAAAELNLRLGNIEIDPTASFSGDFKLDRMMVMPVACISPQFYNILVQFLGGKTTVLGDNVSNSGYIGKYFGFNLYVSGNLAWTGQLVLSVNPTAGDTFTLLNGIVNNIQGVITAQALTFTYVSALVNPGDILIGVNAAATVANTVAALNDPYTTTATYQAYVQSSLTNTQQKLLNGLTASNVSTTLVLQINGVGNVPVAQSMTSGTDVWTATQQKQHNIFGVNKSITVVLQYGPELEILQSNPAQGSNNSGRVGWDFVTWLNYGIKVFSSQAPMLVDVQIRTDGFTTNPVNTF